MGWAGTWIHHHGTRAKYDSLKSCNTQTLPCQSGHEPERAVNYINLYYLHYQRWKCEAYIYTTPVGCKNSSRTGTMALACAFAIGAWPAIKSASFVRCNWYGYLIKYFYFSEKSTTVRNSGLAPHPVAPPPARQQGGVKSTF